MKIQTYDVSNGAVLSEEYVHNAGSDSDSLASHADRLWLLPYRNAKKQTSILYEPVTLFFKIKINVFYIIL